MATKKVPSKGWRTFFKVLKVLNFIFIILLAYFWSADIGYLGLVLVPFIFFGFFFAVPLLFTNIIVIPKYISEYQSTKSEFIMGITAVAISVLVLLFLAFRL